MIYIVELIYKCMYIYMYVYRKKIEGEEKEVFFFH